MIFQKGMIPWNKGKKLHYPVWNVNKKHSLISIDKMRKAKLGKKASLESKLKQSISMKLLVSKGLLFSKEHRMKIGLANKGRETSIKTRLKMSIAKIGKPSNSFGKRWKLSDEDSNSLNLLRPRGEKHYKYIKDRSKLKKDNQRNDVAYKEWRKNVWLRDNYKCKIANPDCKGRLEAHHILGWTAHPELRYQINNGITLCHAHHPRKKEEEAKLSPYFQKLVAEMN